MSDLISLGSLIIFIIITIIYFLVIKNNFEFGLIIYFFAVMISQFILNAIYLGNKCNNSSGTIGIAAFYTFVPWGLIFGVLLGVLIIFPGFKSAFSDVVGYFVVAGKCNTIFSTILIDTEFQETLNNDNLLSDTKSSLSKSAEAIMKICGNKSILINQFNPQNFTDMWNMLLPLMKPDILNNREELIKNQNELLNLVVLRDNVGEAFWYVYSAILISSIVYYNLATQGCAVDVATIKANRDKYIAEQEAIDQKNEVNNSTTYTVDNEIQT